MEQWIMDNQMLFLALVGAGLLIVIIIAIVFSVRSSKKKKHRW